MKISALFLSLIVSSIVFGQSAKLAKADTYYEKLAYAYSAKLYEELLGSEVDGPQLKSKLAMCYYKIGQMDKAETFFRQMVLTDEASSNDYYYYAQTLKQIGNYAESDEWMSRFHKKVDADSRGIAFSENTDYLKTIEEQEPLFSIKHLEINSPVSDFGGYYASDKTTTYFVSARTKKAFVKNEWAWNRRYFLDLYAAKTGSDNEMNSPKKVSKVNTKFHEGPLCFSPDEKYVYFTRNNLAKKKRDRKDKNGIRNLKLYRAPISSSGEWGKEEILPFCSTDYSVGHPSISADGKTLYFASDMPGGLGGSDIYKVSIEGNSFGKPINLGNKINTEGQEMFPWINTEGNLFFSSDGQIGLGGLDIFAVLNDKAGGFSKAINLGRPLNSKNDDFAFSMSTDNKTGYFSSNRSGGKGEDDIYSFNQLKPIKIGKRINGMAHDTEGNILAQTAVTLFDDAGNVLATTFSDDKGAFTFDVEPDKQYTLEGKKPTYFDDTETVNTTTPDYEVPVDLILEKDPGLSLYALVTDKKTGLPLEGVTMTVVDNMSGKQTVIKTPTSGDYRRVLPDKKLNDRGSYNFTLEKEGYFSKTITYNTLFDKPGQYNVHSLLDLGMDPEVKDLSEMVQINPINFDLNKYNIRPDAAKELDKIVEIMNKYPGMVVELGAHTDCRGSVKSNDILSAKRAKSSAEYIKKRITNPERIYGKGYGESRLLNGCVCEGRIQSNCSEEDHAENRRTEFKVISTGNDKVKVNNTSPNSFD